MGRNANKQRCYLGSDTLRLCEPAWPKMAPLANTISPVTDEWKAYHKVAHAALPRGRYGMHACTQNMEKHRARGYTRIQEDGKIVSPLNNLLRSHILKASCWTIERKSKILQRNIKTLSNSVLLCIWAAYVWWSRNAGRIWKRVKPGVEENENNVEKCENESKKIPDNKEGWNERPIEKGEITYRTIGGSVFFTVSRVKCVVFVKKQAQAQQNYLLCWLAEGLWCCVAKRSQCY